MRINKSLITFTPTSGAGSGTVTSVAMTVPGGLFTVTGTPITSSGTFVVGLVNQLANKVWAGPVSGAESVPTFRSLVSDDIPNLDTSKITSGTLGVARGGTGAVTLTGVVIGNGTSAFTGIASTTANQMLRVNSAGTAYEWFSPDYLSNVMTSLGDMIYGNAVGLPIRRSGNITTTKMFLSQTGDGSVSAAPSWSVVTAADTGAVPTSRTISINGTSFDLSANRTYSVGTVTSVALSVPTGLTISGSPITTSGTLAISLTSGYVIPTTASATNWDAAYNDKINSAAVTGTTTKTLTLTQQDGGTITATWTDINTDAVTSVFGRTGAVVATSGDYTTTLVTEGTNLYFTNARAIASTLTSYVSGAGTISSADTILGAIQKLNGNIGALTTGVSSVNGLTGAVTLTTTNIAEGTNLYYTDTRARASLSFVAGSGAYNSTTGAITIPTNNNQITNGAAYITLSSLSAGTGISYNNTTGVITSTITQYTDALARASISETITGIDYNSTTGVFSITSGYGIPTTAKQTEWDTSFTNRITSLTTTGSSGAATLITNTLNIPTYTAAGLGAVPTTRTLTINDVAFDLTADRAWSVGDFGTW